MRICVITDVDIDSHPDWVKHTHPAMVFLEGELNTEEKIIRAYLEQQNNYSDVNTQIDSDFWPKYEISLVTYYDDVKEELNVDHIYLIERAFRSIQETNERKNYKMIPMIKLASYTTVTGEVVQIPDNYELLKISNLECLVLKTNNVDDLQVQTFAENIKKEFNVPCYILSKDVDICTFEEIK